MINPSGFIPTLTHDQVKNHGVQIFSLSTIALSWPANIPHRFRNASGTQGMRIFWTYASIDANRTIVATGDTSLIDAEHGTGTR